MQCNFVKQTVKVSVLQFKFHPFTNVPDFQVRFWTLPDNDALQGHHETACIHLPDSWEQHVLLFEFLLISASPVMTLLHVSSFKALIMSG